MKIAVIGSGGREHAILKKLSQSPRCSRLYALPGNGGMAALATCADISPCDIPAVVSFCAKHAIDYVVVAPDDPLAAGLVDALELAGIPAFGPSKAAAQIEASKTFAKNLMVKYRIPTADFAVFEDKAEAAAYISSRQRFPVVIKADGLALGKGVFICEDFAQAEAALHSIMEERAFGASGNKVLVEEFLTGPEVSVLAFCDGTTVVPMVSSMDHKRLLDGDKGPNTGGMGAVCPNPYYTKEIAEKCMQTIFQPTVQAMEAENAPFKGCLYFGLMLTPDGPKVIEYNCRFGDPETQVVLPLLQSDLLSIMQACTSGTLTPDLVEFSGEASACVVLASRNYPAGPSQPEAISGIHQAELLPQVSVYHSGTRCAEGSLLATGGRVLGVSATAATLARALDTAYAAASHIQFEGCQYRRDIGKLALQAGK